MLNLSMKGSIRMQRLIHNNRKMNVFFPFSFLCASNISHHQIKLNKNDSTILSEIMTRQFSTQSRVDNLNMNNSKDDISIFSLLNILRIKENENKDETLLSNLDDPKKKDLFTPAIISKSFWILIRNKEYSTVIKNIELLPGNYLFIFFLCMNMKTDMYMCISISNY